MEYCFTTQYKENFVYFGISANATTTSVLRFGDAYTYMMFGNGFVATMVDGVNEEQFHMIPLTSQQQQQSANTDTSGDKTACVYGGYANEDKIKVFGRVQGVGAMVSSYARCWTIALSGPSQCGHQMTHIV